MIRIFTGYDPRESAGWHAFVQSMLDRRILFSLTALQGIQGDGSNAFTYSRFLVPEHCSFSGWAIFADGADMLLRADLNELWALRGGPEAVKVVKHEYSTKHPRKYVGTPMESANENYPRKNWSSLILWNCAHPAHVKHRDELRTAPGPFLHRFSWLKDEEIGELPIEWNWLADEYGGNANAKILHWTAGQPGFYHYKDAPHADEWRASIRKVTRGIE